MAELAPFGDWSSFGQPGSHHLLIMSSHQGYRRYATCRNLFQLTETYFLANLFAQEFPSLCRARFRRCFSCIRQYGEISRFRRILGQFGFFIKQPAPQQLADSSRSGRESFAEPKLIDRLEFFLIQHELKPFRPITFPCHIYLRSLRRKRNEQLVRINSTVSLNGGCHLLNSQKFTKQRYICKKIKLR